MIGKLVFQGLQGGVERPRRRRISGRGERKRKGPEERKNRVRCVWGHREGVEEMKPEISAGLRP